jgi:hypothetical protein
MTTNPGGASEAARRRTDLIAGLHDLAAWLTARPDTPLPVVHVNFRVPAGPRGERIAYLDTVAELFGTEVTQDGIGTLFAERQFGPVRAEAHLCHPDQTVSGAMARAANAGTGAQA